MTDNSQQPGDGGFTRPEVYDTIEEASAAATADAALDDKLRHMTPKERALWFENQDLGDVEDSNDD